jgi:hypothetical protein
MIGLSVNDELWTAWKQAFAARFNQLSRYLLWGTKENHENFRTACLWAEIWTQDLNDFSLLSRRSKISSQLIFCFLCLNTLCQHQSTTLYKTTGKKQKANYRCLWVLVRTWYSRIRGKGMPDLNGKIFVARTESQHRRDCTGRHCSLRPHYQLHLIGCRYCPNKWIKTPVSPTEQITGVSG